MQSAKCKVLDNFLALLGNFHFIIDLHLYIDDINSKIIDSNVFSNDNMINTDVLDKISSISTIDISIPTIHVPEINLNLSAP